MSRLRVRAPVVACFGIVVAAGGEAFGSTDTVSHGALLVTAVVLGELFVLRLEDGTGIPLSYAPLLVIAAGFDLPGAIAAWLIAQTVATIVRFDGRGLKGRGATFGHRVAVGGACIATHHALINSFDEVTLSVVLASLASAMTATLVVDQLARRVQRLGSALSPRGARGWLALATTAVLMALAYRGVDATPGSGAGGTGLGSVALFSIPLLAAWYSFERLAAVSRTHRQTLRALSMATELAGFVREGHGERVAVLCEQLASEIDEPTIDREDLVAAAYLHHLGVVTLDDPGLARDPARSALVAEVTGSMLAAIPALEPASRVVSGQQRYARDLASVRGRERQTRRASQILKVASDFDDLVEGDPLRARLALEALYSTPGYVYDRRVLEALDVVVERGA
jgi:hypothetical protein